MAKGTAFIPWILLGGVLATSLALSSLACGAVSGPNSGEIMFEFGADEEPDAGVDSGRRPLSLGDAATPR